MMQRALRLLLPRFGYSTQGKQNVMVVPRTYEVNFEEYISLEN